MHQLNEHNWHKRKEIGKKKITILFDLLFHNHVYEALKSNYFRRS